MFTFFRFLLASAFVMALGAAGALAQSGELPNPTWKAGTIARNLGFTSGQAGQCLAVGTSGGDPTPTGVTCPTGSSSSVSGESVNVSPTYCPYSMLNGTTDTTSCVQTAINTICSGADSPTGWAGGTLVFSRGAYYIKSVSIPKACAGLILKGQSQGNGPFPPANGTWIFSDNNCTGPIINFFSDATQNYVYGGGVRDIGFFNSDVSGGSSYGATSCSHPLIQAQFGETMDFEHLYAWEPYIFIKLSSGLHLTINDILLDQVLQDSTGAFEFTGYGANADSTGQLTRQDQVYLSNVFAGGAPIQAGHKLFNGIWWHGFSASPRFNNLAFENVTTGLKEDCTEPGIGSGLQAANLGACPSFMIANDIEFEGAGADLLSFTDTTSNYIYMLYAHCLLSYGGCSDGVHIFNTTFTGTTQMTIIGGQVDSAQHSCIDASMQGLTVQGVRIWACNQGNSGGNGISIETPTGSDLHNQHTLTGNTFCTSASGGSSSTMTVAAIGLLSGNDYIMASGNNFYQCATGITDASGGTHNVTTGNSGP